MINRKDIERVRATIEENIGARVKITVKKGRKRVVVRHGAINSVYPFTFNVTLDAVSAFSETQRNVSLNYSDLLTDAVTICFEDGTEIK